LVTLTNKENNKTTGLTQNEQRKKLLRDRLEQMTEVFSLNNTQKQKSLSVHVCY